MRTIFTVVAFLLLQHVHVLHAQQVARPQTKHCLWKVQDRTNAIHLLGSIHFLKKDYYPLPKPIEDAYSQSQIVMFETDLDQMEAAETQLKLLEHGKLPESETLKDHLSKATYDKLQVHIANTVGPAGAPMFDMLKPWMVAVALLGVELQKMGFNPKHGIDNYFFNKAKQDKKQIIGLETVDFQLSLFDGLSKEDGDAMMREMLQEISTFKKSLTEIVTAWQTGDIKTLNNLLLQAMRDHPEIHKKLLLDRNKLWVEKIDKLRGGGKNVFVVVGAAHLVGTNSVVDLLQKKGVRIQQL